MHNKISSNATTTKELYISFQKDKKGPPPVTINNNSIEQVTTATLLRVTLAADLASVPAHVNDVHRKESACTTALPVSLA